MSSLHKKRIGKNVYWYARECRRIDGKPKIVWQKYLGRAAEIIATVTEARQQAVAPQPREVRLGEFGASIALYDLARKLELAATIDRHVPKRGRGPSVGEYLLVATLNRCIDPKSKARIGEWFDKSVLSRRLAMKSSQLTSQRFWDNMDRVSDEAIDAIEEEIVARAVERFGLDIRRMLFDGTNFFTFIDSFNHRSTLAQRGKSKEGRASLRIVGVALLVTADFNVPLLHRTYPGNQPDAPTFASLTHQLVTRYQKIASETVDVTLVFDKGNNSEDNLAAIEESPFHFVGSLVPTHHEELLEVPWQEFEALDEEGLSGVSAYRTKKEVFGVERTIVVTYNENLFVSQVQTLMREVAKRLQKLRELQQRLRARREGCVRRGKKPTVESVRKQVDRWLKARHMKELIDVQVDPLKGCPRLTYRHNRAAWNRLQRTLLGKTILFTDNGRWTDAEIIRAYRAQWKVESAFRAMKDPHHLSIRPTHHWTDQKIQVHVFTCVLALMLVSLLQRELDQKGIKLSLPKMIDLLKEIRESVVVYPQRADAEPVLRTTLSAMSDEQRRVYESLNLDRFRSS
jgi:transposase